MVRERVARLVQGPMGVGLDWVVRTIMRLVGGSGSSGMVNWTSLEKGLSRGPARAVAAKKQVVPRMRFGTVAVRVWGSGVLMELV